MTHALGSPGRHKLHQQRSFSLDPHDTIAREPSRVRHGQGTVPPGRVVQISPVQETGVMRTPKLRPSHISLGHVIKPRVEALHVLDYRPGPATEETPTPGSEDKVCNRGSCSSQGSWPSQPSQDSLRSEQQRPSGQRPHDCLAEPMLSHSAERLLIGRSDGYGGLAPGVRIPDPTADLIDSLALPSRSSNHIAEQNPGQCFISARDRPRKARFTAHYLPSCLFDYDPALCRTTRIAPVEPIVQSARSLEVEGFVHQIIDSLELRGAGSPNLETWIGGPLRHGQPPPLVEPVLHSLHHQVVAMLRQPIM
jgi:hypothetical protein